MYTVQKIEFGKTKTKFIDGDRSNRYPKREQFIEDGIMFLNSESIKDGFINKNSVNYISEQKYDGIKKGRILKDDILLTTRGNGIGNSAFVATENRGLINAQMLILRASPDEIWPKFLYYYLKTKTLYNYIINFSSGSAQPQIPIRDLKKISVIVPIILIQQKIAAILSAYDDLIENNKRRITLLEKMAEEIYREWFVRMRFPKFRKTKFNKGIPVNWEIKRLGDILELAYGKALKEADRISGDFPVYGSGGMVGTHNRALIKGPGIIVGRKGNVGSIYWTDKDFYPIDTVYYVKSDLNKYYLYFLLQSMNFINNDAAVPGLNRNQAYANQLFLPKTSLVEVFSKTVKNIFDFKSNLNIQNRELKFSRDMLLSRLISGKQPVEDLNIQHPPSMQNEKDVDHAELHL